MEYRHARATRWTTVRDSLQRALRSKYGILFSGAPLRALFRDEARPAGKDYGRVKLGVLRTHCVLTPRVQDLAPS